MTKSEKTRISNALALNETKIEELRGLHRKAGKNIDLKLSIESFARFLIGQNKAFSEMLGA